MQSFVIAQRKTNYYDINYQIITAFSLTWPAPMQIDWNKRDVYIRKDFSQLPQDWLARQHGRHFIVLEHQYGRRDVMGKRSIVTS